MQVSNEFYRSNGFVVVEGLVSPKEIAVLEHEVARIFRGAYPIDGIVPADESVSDDEVLRKYLCIHQPHKISQPMSKFVRHEGIVNVLTQLIGPNVKCMQSMVFVKPPGFPGQAWHQDEYYIPTQDRSLTGAWIAIDDATIDNRCLWVVPGSHTGALHDVEPQPPSEEYDGIGNIALDVPVDRAIPCEAPSGSVVFFNGYLLHESRKNRSNIYRRALVSHYMNADHPLAWAGEDDFRDVILVAGVDAYADRGYADLSRPWLRPALKT